MIFCLEDGDCLRYFGEIIDDLIMIFVVNDRKLSLDYIYLYFL